MSDAQFTPGPWFPGVLTGDDEEAQVISVGPFSFVGRPHREHHYEDTICEVWQNPNLGEDAEANANLIAAAPELYEALEALFACWPADSLPSGPVCVQASRALAKARGEQS